ncbi:MAG: glycosyltransferase family 4 protein, partial [Gemmataceae bacterium]
GLRVRRVFELREDLRAVFPFGLTPIGRGPYLEWLLSFGATDFQLSPEAALWFHTELDEEPSRGLEASYRLHPHWQKNCPDALTPGGWPKFLAWLRQEYGLQSRWTRRAELTRPQTVPQPGGVNIIGLFRYTSGLQQAVRSTVTSFERVNVPTELRDYPVLFLREPRDKTLYDGMEPHPITIFNTGLDTSVAEAYRKSGLHPRAGTYRIGIWWWEMETLPTIWHARGDEVDEIWAPTQFIADAMRRTFQKPVYAMLPGFELSSFEPRSKATFGMRDDRFTFTFIFDMNSRMQRKNPLGLIQAFRKAFRPEEPVELVLKVSPPESYYQQQWQELRAAVDEAGVTLLDRVLTRSDLLAFLAASDAYASLHRSEGFGLTCAEAMLLGKPVVAT